MLFAIKLLHTDQASHQMRESFTSIYICFLCYYKKLRANKNLKEIQLPCVLCDHMVDRLPTNEYRKRARLSDHNRRCCTFIDGGIPHVLSLTIFFSVTPIADLCNVSTIKIVMRQLVSTSQII